MNFRNRDRQTEYEEPDCIVVLHSGSATLIAGCYAEGGRDDETEARVEEAESREDGVSIRVAEDDLPLSRTNVVVSIMKQSSC